MMVRPYIKTISYLLVGFLLILGLYGCSSESHDSSANQLKQVLSPTSVSDYYSVESYSRSSDNGLGAVATVHPLATQAALTVLDSGGNAIDAAVAAAVTLGVVDSHNSGIGGGNFAVIRYADGSVESIDGREMAPQAASRDMYIQGGKADTSLSKTGALAVGVPGSLAVYDYMLKKAGNFTLADILLPAADLAESGFPLSQVSNDRITSTLKTIKKFPATAKILLDENQQPWPAGHQLIQKDLAYTYRQLAREGIDYFYRGDFARTVSQWMKQHGGIVSYDDFANYEMRIRQPVESRYRGYTIFGFPPPSSGGVHVAQILNILEDFDVANLAEDDRYHLLAEAMKLAFADRAYYLGDPDFVPVPKGLMDKKYASQLASTISFDRAADNVQHGKPPGADIDLFGKHTTHISVADKMGNWVSITTTVNTSFGSKVIVPGTGVILNNQMDDFSIQPGVPNAFGLVGNEANSIASGKRPLSSMSPTIVVKDGKPIMSIGAAGGPTIITQVVQGIVNQIDLGLSAEQALALPRVHHQWRPEVTFIEGSLAESVKLGLQQRGHKFYERKHMGSSQLVTWGPDGQFHTAAEPRIVKRNKLNQLQN
jgi:gamma-glutamyltranspeptidase/glutathione hydrolase